MKRRVAGHSWVEAILRPSILAGMAVCLAIPAVAILEELTRGDDGTYTWRGGYFLVFTFIFSLEGILSERVLRERRITGWAYVASRGAEVLLLLLALKVVNYVPLGIDRLWAEALVWIEDPYEFIQLRDLLTGMLFLPLWAIAIYVARLTRDLDPDKQEASPPPDKTSPAYYLWLTQPPLTRDRQEALDELVNVVLWGGVLMLLVSAGLYMLDPGVRNPALSILIYFALAVTLLTQARFSVSQASWRVQGMSIQPGIARRWLLWSTAFLISVALVALVFPTHFSMGPLTALLGLMGILYGGLMFVVNLILFLLFLPLAWLFPDLERRQFPVDQVPPLRPEEANTSGLSLPWLEMLTSALFWLLVLVIVGYAAYRFWKDRFGPRIDPGDLQATWWGRILIWLQALWHALWTWRGEVQTRVARRLARPKAQGARSTVSPRFFFPGRLPPRELVRYFYLSTARRAAQAGRPRRPGQTPHEYQADLDRHFPDLEPELEGLTSAFVQARYSRRPVDEADVAAARPLWQRIKDALRRRRVQP